jgi:hypothetical protein
MKFISQKLSADLLAGVITTLLGAFALWGSSLIEREEGVLGGPHVVPQAASIFLLCMGLGIVALALLPKEKKSKETPADPFIALVSVGGILYVLAIYAIGYFPATLVFAPLSFMTFSRGAQIRSIGLGLASAVVVYILFFKFLGIFDPPGQYFDFNALFGM